MLRILWPNAAFPAPSPRVADAVRSRVAAPVVRQHGSLLGTVVVATALLGGALSLPASSHAAETRPQRPPAAKQTAAPAAASAKAEEKPAATPTANGPVLQLGIYSGDGDAWWSWKSLQRREPELTANLTASVMLLDGKSESGGVALYAQIGKGVDPKALCRKLVGAGFGCLVVDRPAPSAAQVPNAQTAAVAANSPMPAAAAPAPAPAKPPAVTVAVAQPSAEPQPATKPDVPQPAIIPEVPQPAVKPEPPQPGTTTSVLAPIGSAVAAPLAPPPPSVALAIPPADGTIIYSEEDARTMADIEQHSRRKGRLRSVMPDSRYDVMPATLKKQNWNLCALTFDDGPHRTVTRQVLDILNREGVRATYFPVGRIAERHGELIHDFVVSGHEIGNHSLTHSDLRKMDAAGARYEITEANRILREFGANPVLFRPPYGRYSEDLLAIAREERMGSVLWSVDTRDWQVRNADKIVSQIKAGGMPGNVFLMHSTYPSTAQALPRVIAELRQKGCEFVTLSEWLDRARNLTLPKIVNAGMPSPPADAATDRQ